MSKDIKLKKLGNIDFIPEDGHLCGNCEFSNECPYEYECETLKRLRKYITEIREL